MKQLPDKSNNEETIQLLLHNHLDLVDKSNFFLRMKRKKPDSKRSSAYTAQITKAKTSHTNTKFKNFG